MFKSKEFASLQFTPGDPIETDDLRLGIQQLFVSRYISPQYSENRRLFLKHDTGSGKTISALSAASAYLNLYRETGHKIYIIGFQKMTFQNEIMRRPELGFISHYDYEKLKYLEKRAESNIESQIAEYENYVTWLRRKITTSRFGGVIKFVGYKELNNKVFSEDETPQLNYVKKFEKSFIIFDEIHNTYNSLRTNQYGEAIKFILDNIKDYKALFMSATPINNKPSEIVDIINLVVPKAEHKKEDFFKDEKLKPGALNKIEKLLSGYFSFYSTKDKTFLPTYEIEGKPLKFKGKKIDMLKFIECPISKEHEKVYKKNIDDTLPTDSYGLLDMIMPDGSYKNVDLETLNLPNAKYNGDVVTGSFLELENLGKYSSKYHKMLVDLIENTKNNGGKVMIIHEYVRGTGIKLIAEILRMNGFIPETGLPTDNTLCAVCGDTMADHESTEHTFKPARFGIMHGGIDTSTLRNTMKKYNSENNAYGYLIKIILGSEMIREGYDFKSIRELYIMHPVPNISALIQTMGRPIRKKSHIQLPRELWHVKIRIYITTGGSNYSLKKYYEKIEDYKIIQKIDRVINKNAIDAPIYHDLIKTSFTDKEIGTLKFDITKIRPPKNPNTDLFDVFYKNWEIHEIKRIIISLFLHTPAWKLEDLWQTVRNPPFVMHVNAKMFARENFIIALGDLMYSKTPEPITKNGWNYGIQYSGEYYILFPLETSDEREIERLGEKINNLYGVPIISYTSWLLPTQSDRIYSINIDEEISTMNRSYEEMKERFYKKFNNIDFKYMPKTTEIFDTDFHIRLIEECIIYVFNLYTSPKPVKSEYHYFYFKMLHYYYQLDLIIFAHTLPKEYEKKYDKYISGTTDRNNFLMTSLKSSSITSFEIKEIDRYIEKKPKKVPASILPVGHFLTDSEAAVAKPRLYHPLIGWTEEPEFSKLIRDMSIKENDIIIGYYAHVANSINFKFKIRTPRHLITQKADSRKVEKGMVCETRKKKDLVEIAKKLDIKIMGSNIDICESIKLELIHRELKDRNSFRKGKVKERTRWFYYHFEHDF